MGKSLFFGDAYLGRFFKTWYNARIRVMGRGDSSGSNKEGEMPLNITEQFLEQFRAELAAFPRAYFHVKGPDALPLPPPPTALDWFMGLEGEADDEILVRVMKIVWWLDFSCPGMAHEVRDHWAFDAFHYSVLRFGSQRDHEKAVRALMPVCFAMASVVQCPVCWPHIKSRAPHWTTVEMGR